MLGVIVTRKGSSKGLGPWLPWTWLGLALASTSCTPLVAVESSSSLGSAALTLTLPAPAAVSNQPLGQVSRAAPVQAEAAAAPGFAFRGLTPLDRLRSHDCLAQAIYYEAASESEDGQRAVAQVVLNRVRHPSWPNSVCGVVYQGPMRPGGGCQFTFTCDGSLMRPAAGAAWAQARRLAAEALAGRSFPSIGLATHYHTHQVSPAWAPRLAAVGAIGAHLFYRLPGQFGERDAFVAPYAGREPLPRPGAILFPRATAATAGLANLTPAALPAFAGMEEWRSPNEVGAMAAQEEALPPSTVREEYRHSGQWRADAPAALTGR